MEQRLEGVTTSHKCEFHTMNYKTAKYISIFSRWAHENTSSLATSFSKQLWFWVITQNVFLTDSDRCCTWASGPLHWAKTRDGSTYPPVQFIPFSATLKSC